MTIQTLTLEGVKRACRRAYKAKKLTAQHPNRDKRVCHYVEGEYGCAIGVSLTEATRRKAVAAECNGYGVSALPGFAVADVKLGALPALNRIQVAHDRWCQAARHFSEASEIDGYRNAFLNLIDYPATKA